MFYEETNRVSRRRRQAVDTNPSNLLPDLISPSVTGKTDSTVQITSVPSASSAWSSSTSQVKVHTGVTLEKTTPTKESLYATSEMTPKAESVTVVATELPSPPSIASRSIEASPSNLGNTNSEPTVTAGIPPVTLVSSTVDHHPSSSDVSSFKMTSASIIHNMTAAVTTSSQSQSSTPSLSNSSTPDSQTNYTVSDISLTNGENLRSTAGMPKILATVDTPTSSGSYTKSFTATSITSSDKMNTTGSTMTVMTKQMTSETTDIAGATTPTSGRTSPPSFSTSGLQGRGASTSSVFTAGVNETFTNSNPSSNGPMHTTNTPLHDAATTLSSGRESVSELSSSPPTYTTAKYTNHAATTVVSTGGRGSVSSHPSSTSIYTTTASFGSTSEGRSSSSPLPSGTSRAGMPITSTSSYSSSTINMHFDDSLSTRSAPSDDKYFG